MMELKGAEDGEAERLLTSVASALAVKADTGITLLSLDRIHRALADDGAAAWRASYAEASRAMLGVYTPAQLAEAAAAAAAAEGEAPAEGEEGA